MTVASTELQSAREIASLVVGRKISPVETVTAAIERIEARNPSLNAVVFSDFEGALSRARDLERRIMKGEKVGPLSGVPTLMKDLFDFRAGWPTTLGGIPALRKYSPGFTSVYLRFVERDDGTTFLRKPILITKSSSQRSRPP